MLLLDLITKLCSNSYDVKEVVILQEQVPNSLPKRVGGETFSLKEGVFFASGATRAAIYDTNSGNVYSLNLSAREILEGHKQNSAYWQQLVDLGLAKPKPLNGSSIQLPKAEYKLDFVWFEIMTDDCNERCLHCYADSMPPSYRKEQGLLSHEPQNPIILKPPKLSYKRWCDLIEEAYDLGCRQGQFIGGEPFLYKGEDHEGIIDLAKHAKNQGYQFIEIFTNATLIRQEHISLIKELGLNIAVSLYSNKPEIHDSITRTPGSYQKTMRALNWLKELEIPTRVATILMKQNQQTVKETINLVQQLGLDARSPDVLRPKGRGDNQEFQPDEEYLVRYGLMLKPDFQADLSTLIHYTSGHSCLLGKLTITETGAVLPCIFSRNQVVGNVRATPLHNVLESKLLERIWKTTKDDVLVCQDCEYRYVCFDCRPLSDGAASGNSSYRHAPYPRCTYNPYTGEWGGGIWKVDENGKPYYDETLKPLIEKVLSEGNTINLPRQQGH